MKHILSLIIFLCLFAQLCDAQVRNTQRIQNIREYQAFYDSIAPLLKLAEKDTSNYIGKPFSELVKSLDKYGVKIQQIWLSDYEWERVNPQHLWGISLHFTTMEDVAFARVRNLKRPYIIVRFNESKPYEEALSLHLKYQRCFEGEYEKFYSDATIKSIVFINIDSENIRFPPRYVGEPQFIDD